MSLLSGFSLDSGKAITKKGQLTVVAGAPRANHSGAVVLLKKETEASTMLSPEHILEGEGLASSFGYDLAVVDLTADGYVSLFFSRSFSRPPTRRIYTLPLPHQKRFLFTCQGDIWLDPLG